MYYAVIFFSGWETYYRVRIFDSLESANDSIAFFIYVHLAYPCWFYVSKPLLLDDNTPPTIQNIHPRVVV